MVQLQKEPVKRYFYLFKMAPGCFAKQIKVVKNTSSTTTTPNVSIIQKHRQPIGPAQSVSQF